MLDRDKLNHVKPEELGELVIRLVDRSQTHSQESQVIAAGCYFKMLCEHFNISIDDVFTIITNIEKYLGLVGSKELNAAREYVKHEL